MTTNLSAKLATLVSKAAAIREASYDKASANEATAKASDLRVVDYKTFYGKSLREAVAEACATEGVLDLSEPVFLLLYYAWNDIVDWADQVTKNSISS